MDKLMFYYFRQAPSHNFGLLIYITRTLHLGIWSETDHTCNFTHTKKMLSLDEANFLTCSSLQT